MTDLDRMIHEPARLLLVALLASVKEADFLWLQHESDLTKGNLSSHLMKLENAGYVAAEKTPTAPGLKARGSIPEFS
jgi:DNA-binding transcriptional ArsR family regulator